jgi:hypothetical protein
MPPTKNQHYVSQFYLKGFSPDGTTVYGFDKSSKKSFKTHLRNVAAERFFYDIPPHSVSSGDPQGVEKTLSAWEGLYAPAIRVLIDEVVQTGRFTPGWSERNQIIAHFLVIQYIRTREFRNSFGSMIAQLSFVRSRLMAKRGETVVSKNPIEPIPHDMPSLAHARCMFDESFIEWITGIFLGHVWLIGDNQTDHHLYTSDAPISISSTMPHGHTGFGSRGVEIALPLCSRFMLFLCERNWFTQTQSGSDGDVVILDDAMVKHYNGRHVCQCLRQIYCQEDQFDVAREVIEKYPEICDVGRSRFLVRGKL